MAKNQCKHPNVTIHEPRTATGEFFFENGKLTHDNTREGNPTGQVIVTCKGCGYAWRGRPAKLPKWAKKLWDQI